MHARTAAALAAAVVVAALAGAGGALLLTGGDDDPGRPIVGAEAPASPAESASPAASARPTPSPSPRPTRPPAPALTDEALRSAPVPSLCGHPAGRLRDGVLPGIPKREGGVELSDVVIGDLDGDGVAEAAAVIGCSSGNSVTDEVIVYRTGLRLVGVVPIGEGLPGEVRGDEPRIAGGRLEVSGRFVDDGDGRCCPSGYVVRQYRVLAGELAKVPARGLDPKARLTGDGWGPVRVSDSYEEVARATGLPVRVESLDEEGDVADAACTYVSLIGGPRVGLMGGEGAVRAIVFGDKGVLSKSGVGVGSTEQEVLDTYGDRARREPNEYVEVDDVYVQAGPGLVLRFEFDDEHHVVQQMHAGEIAYASLIEGCA